MLNKLARKSRAQKKRVILGRGVNNATVLESTKIQSNLVNMNTGKT